MCRYRVYRQRYGKKGTVLWDKTDQCIETMNTAEAVELVRYFFKLEEGSFRLVVEHDSNEIHSF